MSERKCLECNKEIELTPRGLCKECYERVCEVMDDTSKMFGALPKRIFGEHHLYGTSVITHLQGEQRRLCPGCNRGHKVNCTGD